MTAPLTLERDSLARLLAEALREIVALPFSYDPSTHVPVVALYAVRAILARVAPAPAPAAQPMSNPLAQARVRIAALPTIIGSYEAHSQRFVPLAAVLAILDAAQAAPAAEPDATEVCMDCDGVGWVEGGKALQTTCQRCNGTGAVPRWPRPTSAPAADTGKLGLVSTASSILEGIEQARRNEGTMVTDAELAESAGAAPIPPDALREALARYVYQQTMFDKCVECGQASVVCATGPFECEGGCPQGCRIGPLRAALAGPQEET